ncbi:hypothetical protein GQ43DRAFT_435966 [Delitschia confertaspora ATCC 74209]|uniref:Transmembrane protein 135 N-terminal domain-containing protein n=1 Tax=Delitschia confertaspora ATCC 74209 TaxID=1513339 RepID=A0A9P4JC85_9PLEO|nr:hypothetical protein GQ43DRAFT_435966 [Delitschia confertaspora ATCC 74209]
MSSKNLQASSAGKPERMDPILRNALRYTVSPKEYRLLHQYLLSRAPVTRKHTPPPKRYDAVSGTSDDYNAAAIRVSLRLAVLTFSSLKTWELLTTKIVARGPMQSKPTRSPARWKSANVRLSCSLSLILLFHRLLRRFFTRLRESLLTNEAKPFRRRNPRISRSLTSGIAPAIGSSLAGFFLAVCPSNQLRITIAIYVFTRALEFSYNYLEDRGWFKDRPAWFGSWLLMPVACGQLLHTLVFDRDCFPATYGRLLLNNSPAYIQKRPADYPTHLPWPNPFEIVDSLAEISKMRWAPFISPIIFPSTETLPRALKLMGPITSPAHPAISSLSCALFHPNDPSCARTYISYWIQAFPKIARFFTIMFAALSITKYRSFLNAPAASLNRLAKSILRMSIFLTGAVGTSWGSMCLFQNIFPRTFLPTQRWFLGGFLGGLWAFLERKSGRGNFLYSARMSIDSLWKVGVKRGWWRGIKNGDVLLFTMSLALINATYEVSPESVSSGVMRKGLGMLRGEGWVDRASVTEGEGKEEKGS